MANVYNIMPRKKSVLNTIALREQGIVTKSLFQHEVMCGKLNQLPKFSELTRFEEDSLFPCNYFRTRPDGSMLGVHHSHGFESFPKEYSSFISVHEYSYNSLCRKIPNSPLTFISNLKAKSCLYEPMHIVDTVDVYHHFQTPLLVVGNHSRHGSEALLTYFDCEHQPCDLEWLVDSQLYCCASNAHSDRFALGGVGGYHLFKCFAMDKKQNVPSNVLSLEFNDDGNLLFIGTEKGIEICDCRENSERNIKRGSSGYTSEEAISGSSLIAYKMQLLSDQVSLIVSDMTRKISKVDLRMRKPVFWYSEHVGKDKAKTLSLSEDLDLLCAVGRDNNLRVWSLSSGKLYWKKDVNLSDSPCESTHCCLNTHQRKWFITVAVDEQVVPIVPDSDNIIW